MGNMIASQLYDCTPLLARWLVLRAIVRLPQSERDRYREEWLSHLAECPGKLTGLYHAFGCLRASGALASFSRARPKRAHTRTNRLLFAFFGFSSLLLHRRPHVWREGMLNVARRSLKKVKPKGNRSEAEEIERRVALLEAMTRRTRATRELFQTARHK
jgi:hypothetical protein